MDKKDFVAELPSHTRCTVCDIFVDAPTWRVSAFDLAKTEWLAVNVTSCPNCGIVIVGSAGSSLPAHEEAKRVRQKLLLDAIRSDKKK